ncbi:MAG: hypothetical protein IIX40_03010 [Alistipes sp.]|nr:hypothetical protein [Alistipes sp.]
MMFTLVNAFTKVCHQIQKKPANLQAVSIKTKEQYLYCSERKVLVLNLNLPISFDSMSYISLSTNLVAKCDIQVDAAKVADIFDLPKFGATFLSLEERNGYIRRVFAFSKNTFRVKRRGAGLNHLSS